MAVKKRMHKHGDGPLHLVTWWVRSLRARVHRPGMPWRCCSSLLASASRVVAPGQASPWRHTRARPTAVSRLKKVRTPSRTQVTPVRAGTSFSFIGDTCVIRAWPANGGLSKIRYGAGAKYAPLLRSCTTGVFRDIVAGQPSPSPQVSEGDCDWVSSAQSDWPNVWGSTATWELRQRIGLARGMVG